MPEGSCFCGKCRITYTGEPVTKAVCHCRDCQKISGSTYSTNTIVSEDGFKVTEGKLKSISKTADGGNTITSHFCGDCGSTLFRDGPTFPGMKVVKAGVLDDVDALEHAKPGAELFTTTRVSWVPEIAGAAQKPGMP